MATHSEAQVWQSARLATGLSRRSAVLIALLIALIGMFCLVLAVGSVSVPLEDVLRALLGQATSQPAYATIVTQFRMPRALTALLAGAALAVGGVQMQTLFRNPLTDPFVLGISAGASLGVALVVLAVGTTGATVLVGIGLLGDFGLAAAASVGAALMLSLVLGVAQRARSVLSLLIVGLMLGYAVSAVVSLLLYFSVPERIQAYVNWTFGSFGGVTWRQLPILAPIIGVGLALSLALIKPLNALLLGEAYAQSMGIDLRRARIGVILSTSLLAGAVTAFCGPIGFLGIAVPHISRILIRTADHRWLLPTAMLLGALIAMLADLVAQVPGRQIILPLNAITALIGAPIVLLIVLSQRRLRDAFSA
ncbi:MAG: iron ABC transporter permease [Anaerolineae bacterium]|nr:iron ABC transporter permease [Anaerolineae bacterium]